MAGFATADTSGLKSSDRCYETGAGSVQEKQKALLSEIVAKLNAIFEGDLTDGDQLTYFIAFKSKVAESPKLRQQALNNTKEQFSNSPDLKQEATNAIMDLLTAHTSMSKQALESDRVRTNLLELLLGQGRLWEELRAEAGAPVEKVAAFPDVAALGEQGLIAADPAAPYEATPGASGPPKP